jgi:hypothetical protein
MLWTGISRLNDTLLGSYISQSEGSMNEVTGLGNLPMKRLCHYSVCLQKLMKPTETRRAIALMTKLLLRAS